LTGDNDIIRLELLLPN